MLGNLRFGRVALLPALVVALAVGVVGCGGPKPYKVKGKVIFKGDKKPMTGGQVIFLSVGEPQMMATGLVEPDGTFSLDSQFGHGAVEGEYRVRVEPEIPDGPQQGRMLRNPRAAMATIVDKRYLDVNTSGLTFLIKPGENDLTIEVERPRR